MRFLVSAPDGSETECQVAVFGDSYPVLYHFYRIWYHTLHDPKPLKLSVTIPSAKENEAPQTLLIEVKVKAGEGAGYAVESANMKFRFAATEVLLGEGEEQTSLPGFHSTTFDFDMNQVK